MRSSHALCSAIRLWQQGVNGRKRNIVLIPGDLRRYSVAKASPTISMVVSRLIVMRKYGGLMFLPAIMDDHTPP